MRRCPDEIHHVLDEGLRILEKRPELWSYSVQDIINELDDGTREMMSNRWGVAAHALIHSISNFELSALVAQLAQLHPKQTNSLAYNYVGYLLQRDYGVALDSLLVEAHHQCCFEKLLDYVVDNFPHLTTGVTVWTVPLLDILGNYPAHRSTVLWKYADGVASYGDFSKAMTILGELDNQTQADFACNLIVRWIDIDPTSGRDALCQLVTHRTLWSKLAFLMAMDRCQYVLPGILEDNFSQMQQFFSNERTLWLKGIPVLVHAVAANLAQGALKTRIMEYLEKLPDASLEEKKAFLSAIQCGNKLPGELVAVLDSMLRKPFGEDELPLDLLDDVLYFEAKEHGWQIALQWMEEIFEINTYEHRSSEFFNAFDMVIDLLHENIKEVMEFALSNLASNKKSKVFFSVGLLQNLIDDGPLPLPIDHPVSWYTDIQLARMLKSLMYLSIKGTMVCHSAFQFIPLTLDPPLKYSEIFWNDIYANYPNTLFKIAEYYSNSNYDIQKQLAKEVISKYTIECSEQEKAFQVIDFRPSLEQQEICARSRYRLSKQINSKARESSILEQFFPTQILKYGTKNAHVISSRNGKNFFHSSAYHKLEYSTELPHLYTIDPVKFWFCKSNLIREMTTNETNSKRLFTTVEGER